MTAATIEIKNVTKIFAAHSEHAVTALDRVSLTIGDNEFFTLLGPSGCGKTTLLRLVAGFEYPTDGEVLLFGERLQQLPPQKRPVNTVFQHYALFPHMTVLQNVGFGLKMLGRERNEIYKTSHEMLELVKMQAFANRRPHQLSGGQQQRIALARALAARPKVLLLDEPLSALDLKLRQEMREELKTLQRETGITFVFVTHDQVEALTMSDRIAVMSMGRIQQEGFPTEIYEKPINRFVADFIGETNFLEATIDRIEAEGGVCVLGDERLELQIGDVGRHRVGDGVTLALRPEKIAPESLGCRRWEVLQRTGRGQYLFGHGHLLPHFAGCQYPDNGSRSEFHYGRGPLQSGRKCQIEGGSRGCPHSGGLMNLPTNRTLRRIFGLGPAVGMIFIFMAVPIGIIAVYSFLEANPYGGVRPHGSLAAYVQFLFERDLDDSLIFNQAYLLIFWRSFLLALGTTFLCLLIGFPTAYYMAMQPPKRRNLLVFLVTIPFWTNLLIRTFCWILILRDTGIINNILLGIGVIEKPLTLLYTNKAILLGLVYTYVPFMVLPHLCHGGKTGHPPAGSGP